MEVIEGSSIDRRVAIMRMLVIVSVVASLLSSYGAMAGTEGCATHLLGGQAPVITDARLAPRAHEICYSAYAVSVSGITHTALWAAEHLTRDSLERAREVQRDSAFHEDPNVPPGDGAELRDYYHSGYDRGHMAPSGDMPTAHAQYESFSLANMVPQDHDNNGYLWEGIEASVRSMASRSGEIYVVTGPLFDGGSIRQLRGGLLVPNHLFKAVYNPARNEAGAYITANAPGTKYELVSIAELETRAGINVFPALPQSVKDRIMDLPAPRPYKSSRSQGRFKSLFSNLLGTSR